jgi:prepilin-type N-terminal cleavage/methylation domain-containing protein
MKTPGMNTRRAASGFTLVEMLISVAVLTVVIVGTFNVFVQNLRSYNASTLMRTSATRASLALDRMVYGVGTNIGLREVPKASVTISNVSSTFWRLSFTNSAYFQWSSANKCITDQSGKSIGTNIVTSTLGTNGSGCTISLSVAESGGGRTITNTMTTFVQFRN